MGKSVKALILRGTAVVCYLIASIIMFASNQKVNACSVEFVARDTDWNGLLFFAIVSISVCCYNLFVLGIPSNSLLWRTVILLDLIICILSCTSLGVGWQTYLLFLRGNQKSVYANWSPICGIVPIFCRQILVSLIFSTIGFVFSFALHAICISVSVDAFMLEN